MIPYLYILGLRGMRSAFTNIIYAKIGNRLVPPPLNKGVFYRFSEAFYPLRRVFHFTEISSHLKKTVFYPFKGTLDLIHQRSEKFNYFR